MSELPRESAEYWVAREIDGLALLRATYTRHTFPKHTHDHYVVGVNEGGVEGFHYRGALWIAPAGTIVLVNPGEVHTGHSAGEDAWEYRGMYPTAELLAGASSQVADRPRPAPDFPEPVVDDPALARAMRRAHRALEEPGERLERESAVLAVLAALVSRHAEERPRPKPPGREHRAVALVRDLLSDRAAESVSLDDLARLAGLSPFHLLRVFRRETGLAPHQFLVQARVERAKRLLERGLPLARVAAEAGFFDQSHLTRKFKAVVGVTPARYARGR